MARDELSQWLKTVEPQQLKTGIPKKCETCKRFSHLDPDIKLWLAQKAEGKLHLPTHSHVGGKSLLAYLATKGYDLSGCSLVRHIVLCLRTNHTTGKPH